MGSLVSNLLIAALAVVTASSCKKNSSESEQTITAYAQWSQTIEEYPTPDNRDLLNPDYTSFHKSLEPG
jgi:hypothetical protein